MIKGCELPHYQGDNYCDDENNNLACNYDGGDCCGSNANTEYCTECLCLDENNAEFENPNVLIGNGICNAETNNIGCMFDGFDCCLSDVNTENCHGT